MMDRHRRKRKKQLREAFKLRCMELSKKVQSIDLSLHWSRSRGEPRQNTMFSLWPYDGCDFWIVKDLNINEMEEYIDRYYKLRAFL